MKLLSFRLPDGRTSYGALKGEGIVDLGAHYGARAPDLASLLAQGLIADAAGVVARAATGPALASVQLTPPIPNPGKIICVGLNYHDHVKETGRALTEKPALFLRVADSLVAHGEAIVRPAESTRLDYEGEIVVVIGPGGRRIAEGDAWKHVAGYSIFNDGSVRDWQNHTTQWTAGKNYWRTGGFGPWIVTTDELPGGSLLALTTRLNGVQMQHASTDMLIHSIPSLIAYISAVMPLAPGDVIVTGTPGGVGNKREPQVFMKPGDVVEIEVSGVGVLRNTIVDG